MPDVRVLDAAALKQRVAAWDDLAAAAAEPNPFYESWLMLPALEAFPDPDFLCVAVSDGGRLDGLFPLRRAARYRGLPARALRSWRHRHMLLCTPLLRAGAETGCLEALLRWLSSEGSASILEIEYLNGDGAARAALRSALEDARRPWSVTYRYERPLLVRAKSADALLSAIEKRWYADIRRRERRWKEAGRAEYVRLGPAGDIGRWIDDFLRIEAAGWKGRAGSALACREPDRRFAEALFRGAFERGRLLGVGVDLDGRPLAREMCLLAGEGAYVFKIAYDETNARFSPGLLAEIETIRAFHADPRLQWMDSFTAPDNTTHVRLWAPRRRIERISAAIDAWGAFMLSLLPVARWAKQKVRGARPLALPQ